MRNFNSKDISTTGLNTAQITEKKKQHAKDLNIDDRTDLFQDQLADEFVYRIPLRYFSDIGKINFPTKINYRIKLFLETDMTRLFESRKVLAAITTSAPDKSDKHSTIYNSYNRELAAQKIKTLQLSNFTEIYSLTNEKKYNIDNLTQKHLLYK